MAIDRSNVQVSADASRLRPNDAGSDTTDSACPSTATLGKTGPAAYGVARRDPRATVELSPRDFAALRYIGMWICAQYQVALAHFAGLSETVVSRCIRRLLRLELISVTRWNRIGLNLLQITTGGVRLLVERGIATEQELHCRRSPIRPKDTLHSLWICDVGLALMHLPVHFDVLPCWALRRRLAGQKVPIPDLLAVSKDGKRTIAIEVDLATERTRVVLEKLKRLSAAVESLRGDGDAAIVVLTQGSRRIDVLRANMIKGPVPILVEALPSVVGRPSVPALMEILLR
ncbi:MAG: replication-relaxation family protein [Thermoanaerobaculia bacterium]